jgi:hypothetical protein
MGALLVKRKFRQTLIYPFAEALLLGPAEQSIPLPVRGAPLGARD